MSHEPLDRPTNRPTNPPTQQPPTGYPSGSDPVAPSPGVAGSLPSHTAAGTQSSSGGDTKEVAKEAAGQVASDAKQQGQAVAETAKEELSNVGVTAKDEAKRLVDTTRSELTDQAGTQQQKLASGLHALAAELQEMARGGEHHGPASDLAQQAGGRAEQIATWLDGRDPGDVLNEVRRFAARRPGAFLAIAAGVGLLAGRLTRGLTADQSDQSATGGPAPRHVAGGYPQPGPAGQNVVPSGLSSEPAPQPAPPGDWQDAALPGPRAASGVPDEQQSLPYGDRPTGAYGGSGSGGPLDPSDLRRDPGTEYRGPR